MSPSLPSPALSAVRRKNSRWVEGLEHRPAGLLHLRGDLLVHVVAAGHPLVDHVHDGVGRDVAGGEEDLPLGVAHPVVGGHHPGDEFLHQVGLLRRFPEEGPDLVVTGELVGGGGPHAAVRLHHHRVARLGGEGQGGLQGGELQEPGGGHPRRLEVLLHEALALVLDDLVRLQTGGDVEVGAQGGVQLQPELVVALHPVQLAVLAGEVAQGPDHLVVVGQAVHLIVLRQGRPQIGVELLIPGIPHPQHVDPVLPEPDAEPPVGLGKIGGNKDKVHTRSSFLSSPVCNRII